jgi:hypothetical protein
LAAYTPCFAREGEEVIPLGEGGPSPEGWHSGPDSAFDCLKKYQLKEVRKVRPVNHQTPEPFAVGSLFHAGRARWFAGNFGTDAATAKKVREAIREEHSRLEPPSTVTAIQKAMDIMEQYIDFWSQKPLPKPLAAEHLLGPARITEQLSLTRTARLDDVSEYPGVPGLWIGEAKTTSQGEADVLNIYTVHGQPMLQKLLWRTAPQGMAAHGRDVEGVMFDVVKKPEKEKGRVVPAKFSRIPQRINSFALAWFVDSLQRILGDMSEVTWDSEAPRNPNACTKMYGRMRVPCAYRDLCANGRDGAMGYVYGPDAKNLVDFRPEPGKEKKPWE